MRRVVVTGIGALTPIGKNIDEYWSSLMLGVSGSNLIKGFDTTDFKVKFACELNNYDPLDHFDKKEIRQFDKFTQYALISVDEAVKKSRINFDETNREKVGVIWSSGNGGIQTFYDQVSEFIEGNKIPRFNPYFIPRILVDIAAGIISIKYGLHGVNFCPVSACASSNTAIIEAYNYIRWNKADLIITGGSDAPINPTTIGGFSSARALSTNNLEYSTASRPFDTSRDGFVMGEGAGALILEELEHARKRNAPIIGEIVGGGMAADAYHITGTHPNGKGAVIGMKLALEEANVTPNEISSVNMHATSTPLGDSSELNALMQVFGKRTDLTISATKSMTGHLLGAAGAVEAIASLLSLQHQKIPMIANTQNIDSEYKNNFDFPLNRIVEKNFDYVLSNTFGFGGHVASLLLKKWED